MATEEVRRIDDRRVGPVSSGTTRSRRSPVRAGSPDATRVASKAFTPRVQPPVAAGGRWLPDELVVSAVVPAYNEEDLLAASVTELVTGLRARQVPFEVVIVENGSADGTLPLAHALAAAMPEVVVISLSVADYGRALRAGLLEARGTFVANFDADFFDLGFLDAALAGLAVPEGPSIVVGTKRGPGSVDTRAWPRRLVTAVFSTVLRAGFGLGVSDTHGMKVMRRARRRRPGRGVQARHRPLRHRADPEGRAGGPGGCRDTRHGAGAPPRS